MKEIEFLGEWSEVVYDNEEKFLEKFCNKAWIISSVSWNDAGMKIVYILHCGKHISDSVPIDKWLEFLSQNKD